MDKVSNLFKSADRETRNGNYPKAIEHYQEIIKLSQDDTKAQHLAYWGIGEIYLNNKQYDKAELYLIRAINLKPDEPIYHYLLGCTYTYINEIDKAIFHLEKAIALDDSQDVYWDQLGWVYGFNRDVNKGIQYLKKALKINPQNTRALRDICMLYTQIHKWHEALVCIEEALKYEPDNEELFRIREDIEYFKSEFERLSKLSKE